MLRDPLDELIETLEAALPSASGHDPNELLPRLADLQMVICPILFGSEKDRERIEATAMYHRVMAQLALRPERWTKN